jgi:hypothetical protein
MLLSAGRGAVAAAQARRSLPERLRGQRRLLHPEPEHAVPRHAEGREHMPEWLHRVVRLLRRDRLPEPLSGHAVSLSLARTPRMRVFLAITCDVHVYPKDLRVLPGHPEPALSWHSGFRGGAHARPQTTPVHYAARRRGSRRLAAGGARAADRAGAAHRRTGNNFATLECRKF